MGTRKRSHHKLDADLLTLRALVAVADRGSFSAAAKIIGRSQSAVSLQIAKLEDRMEVRLLDRTSRSVRQTQAGETFIAYARRILELADDGLAAVTTPDVSEPLRIGFAEYLVPEHLHIILARFKRAQPRAKLELHLGVGFKLYHELTQNRLDVVVAGPEADDGLALFTEPLVWVGPKNGAVTMEEESIGLILMPPPCSYRKAAFDALTAAGIPWHVAVSANSVRGVQSAVTAGLGISVMARSAVNRELDIIRRGFPVLPNTSINAYWDSSDPHPLADRFISFIEEELKSIDV